MTEDQLSNFDLDVLNALKDFPKDNENGVIYLRVKMSTRKIEKSFIHTRANMDAVSGLVFSFLSRSEIRPQVLNAMLNFFKMNKNEIANFSEYLRQIKNENL